MARRPVINLLNVYLVNIEVLHGSHIATQEQKIIFPKGKKPFFLMQNIFIVPAMQHGCLAKPLKPTEL